MKRQIQNTFEQHVFDKLEEGISERGYGYVLTDSLLNDKDIVFLLAKNGISVDDPKTKEFLNYKIRRVVKNAAAKEESAVAKMINQWESIVVDTKGYHIYPGRERLMPNIVNIVGMSPKTDITPANLLLNVGMVLE